FCVASGQSINKSKSKVYFSNNVSRPLSREITSTLGIGSTSDLGRYLGVPILHGRVTKHTYDFIQDRMNSRLAEWKAVNLSLAGRVTLATSVLNSIPSYIMQTAFLPFSLCDKIDRIIRNFIWGSEGGTMKIHNVNWEIVCKPKKFGGLGLRSAMDLNKAFLLKLVWNLISRPNELWAKVLISKYMILTENGYMLACSKGFSLVWRSIMKVWNDTPNGIHWSIRNGKNKIFLTDRWVDCGTVLIDHALDLQGVVSSISVSDFYLNDGSWDLPKLREVLPENVVWQVYGISLPREELGEDMMVWGLEPDGRFSVKSAYNMLLELNSEEGSSGWARVWNWEGPNKVKHFLWLATHGKLMTNVERAKRRFTQDTTCEHCNNQYEDTAHVMRNCEFARNVWRAVLPEVISAEQGIWDFDRWWNVNLGSSRTG
ncbi:Putative ribonuclease H protein At1g65750, partial [Linum perenne]